MCFLSVQSNSRLSPGVFPKPAAPAPSVRAWGTEVSLLTALPPNVSAAVSWDTVYLTPAICAKPLGIKHIAGVNPFPTGESVNGSKQSIYIKKTLRVHSQVCGRVTREEGKGSVSYFGIRPTPDPWVTLSDGNLPLGGI